MEKENNGNSMNKKKSLFKRIFCSEDSLKVIMFTAIFITLIFMVITFFSEFKDLFKGGDEVISTTTSSLASIEYDKQVEGSYNNAFIIGKGQISEKEYYVAYQILDDGGKKLVKLEADKTIIYDILKSSDIPYVEYDLNKWNEVLAIRLYVPEGTITQNYDLDL